MYDLHLFKCLTKKKKTKLIKNRVYKLTYNSVKFEVKDNIKKARPTLHGQKGHTVWNTGKEKKS